MNFLQGISRMKGKEIRFRIHKFLLGNQVMKRLLSIENIEHCVCDIINKININNKKIDSIIDINKNICQLEYISKYVSSIDSTIKKYPFFYQSVNKIEKEFALIFLNYMNNGKFREEYTSLIQDMDDESIKCINLILSRLILIANEKKYCHGYGDSIKFYNLLHEFFENIITIKEKSLYIYKHYMLPINHFEPCVFYYKLGIDKINSKNRFMNKDIIDAGAFIGDSALILSEYTTKKVYAFEPVKKTYETMIKTIELNNRKNIIPVNKGLADTQREEEIYIGGSASGLVCKSNVRETVELITLDEFVMNSDIEVGLIKTDLEGFEFPFLLGAINTIKRFKPVLLISVYHKPEDFFRIKPFLESLDLGYTFKFRKPVDGSALLEAVLIAE